MGIFINIFGPPTPAAELDLENFYVDAYKQTGIRRRDIREAISKCKAESKLNGMDDLPPNFGDYLIEQAKFGNEKYKVIVDKAVLGGAKEVDIRHWWNLSDLKRRMINWEDVTARIAAFRSLKQAGHSDDEALLELRKSFPVYGDPSDELNMQGEDRPLPAEMHERVNQFVAEMFPQTLQIHSSSYSSMNAFLRMMLK
jgi:hypothetical protein